MTVGRSPRTKSHNIAILIVQLLHFLIQMKLLGRQPGHIPVREPGEERTWETPKSMEETAVDEHASKHSHCPRGSQSDGNANRGAAGAVGPDGGFDIGQECDGGGLGGYEGEDDLVGCQMPLAMSEQSQMRGYACNKSGCLSKRRC